MNVTHKPIEDIDIAVNRDVDIVGALGVRQILFKVLHVGYQQQLIATEVLIHLLVLVTNVYDDSGAATD